MTQQEQLISTFRNLSANEQVDVTMAFLQELAKSNVPSMDEAQRIFLDQRIQAADEYPEQLIPADEIFRELSEE